MFDWIKNLFNKAIQKFKEFIKIAFPILLQTFLGLLKDFAISTVSKLESTDLSNEEKRTAAFNEIATEAKNKGIEFKSSWIFLLIEIALQAYKEMNKE